MRRLDGEAAEELLPVSHSARTRVHECGGRSYLPLRDGPTGPAVLFTEYADQRIYRMDLGTRDILPLPPVPPRPTGYRYADMVLAPDAKNVWCVRESHGADPGDPAARPTVIRDIVAIPLDGGASADPRLVYHLTGGSDFVACPRPSPGGNWLAWIRWDHPRMPWDGAELCAAPVEANGTTGAPHVLMGG